MTNPEDQRMASQAEKEASAEQPLAFTVGETVKVTSDTVDAALLWQVAEVKEVSGYYILRAVGDPNGELHAFKQSEVSAVADDSALENMSFPKLRPLSEDESNSLVMSAQIEEYVRGLDACKPPERESEAANEAIEDLGEQAVHEVVAEVNPDDEKLKEAEAGIHTVLARASEVFKDKYKIDEELRGLLQTLAQDMIALRALGLASNPQMFQQQAREFMDSQLNETSKQFALFNKDSLNSIQDVVVDLNRRTKAAEKYGETYDDLKPVTIGLHTPVTTVENSTQSIAFKLRKTGDEVQRLINKSFREQIEPSELRRIVSVYDEYSLDNPAMTAMIGDLKKSMQGATKAIENRTYK